MTDINDIQQDLQSIEEIINGPSGLIQTKAAIKRALEAKLNVSIPDENPLKIYDDYIYMIPSTEGNSRTLVLGESTSDNYQMYPIDFKDSDWFYINPNGETSISDNNLIFEGDTTKRYSSIGNVAIKRPESLTGSNIINGVTIFGVEGCGGDPGGINPDGINTTADDIPDNKIGLIKLLNQEGYDKTSGNVQDIRTGAPFNWNTTNINLTENSSFVFNLPTIAELDSNPDNLRVKENVIIDGNFGLETNFSDLVNAVNESNNELDMNKILPENIKTGCTLLGVSGTFTADANATTNNIIYGKTAYVNGEKVTGRIPKRIFGDDVTIVVAQGTPRVTLKAGSYWYDSDGESTTYSKNINLPTYNFSFISSSLAEPTPEKDNYLSGSNTITLTPELNVTRDGYLLTGQDTGTSTDVTAGMIINQDYFSDEFLDSNGYTKILPSRMLSGTIGVDQFGNVLKGTIPIFTSATHGNIEWRYTSYNNNGLITSPSNGSQWGYYNTLSNVLITNEKIKSAYNRYISENLNKLAPENIRAGSTILGTEGTYAGDITVIPNKEIFSGDVNFKNNSEIVFLPGENEAYGKITLYRPENLSAENIVANKSFYGITGTFSKSGTQSPNQSVATANQLLSGYSAWVNGDEVKGNIINRGYLYSSIQDPYTSIDILAGYYQGGSVRVDSAQLNNLNEINIRNGVTIFGVTGTYSGGKLIYLYHGYYDKVDPDLDSVPVIKLNDNNQVVINDINSNNRFCIFSDDINLNRFSSPQNNESSPLVKDFSSGTTAVFHIIPLVNNNTYRGYVVTECMGKISVYSSPTDTNPTVIFNDYMSPVDESFLRLYPTKGGFSYTHEMKKPTKVEFKLYENGHNGLTWEIKIIELPDSLYDTSAADPDNSNGADSSDVASGKIFFNNTGSHNGTLIDGRAGVISVNSSLECYNSDNNVFYFHPVNDSIIDSGLNPPIDAPEYFVLQSGLAVSAGYIGQNTPNLSSGNIRSGVDILGVTGSLSIPQITQDPITGIVTII